MKEDGNVFGPFWLSQMRDLYQKGKLRMKTQVCMEGTNRWEPLEFYPEIFEEESRMPVLAKLRRSRSDPGRLVVWLILLVVVIGVWWLQQWGRK